MPFFWIENANGKLLVGADVNPLDRRATDATIRAALGYAFTEHRGPWVFRSLLLSPSSKDKKINICIEFQRGVNRYPFLFPILVAQSDYDEGVIEEYIKEYTTFPWVAVTPREIQRVSVPWGDKKVIALVMWCAPKDIALPS